jgi:chaperonin GroEL
MKSVKIGTDARTEAVNALGFISSAVGTTLGPKGLSFIIEKSNGLDGKPSPVISKDGISVMKAMSFVSPIEHAVHSFCVQASSHTVYSAGDGTTSTIVMASAIAKEILHKNPSRPQAFAREIKAQAESAIAAIGREVRRDKELAEICALTASNGDREMVKWVMECVQDNPVFGSIIIERSPAAKENYAIVKQEGITAGRGYNQHLQFAHSFSDQPAENAPFEIDTPYILLYDGDLISESQIAPILNKVSAFLPRPFSLVIVAYEVGNEVANTLATVNLHNKGNASVWASAIRLSAEVNGGWHRLQDLAAFSGATITNFGQIQNLSKEHLGLTKKIIVSPEKTIFIGRSPSHWIPKRAVQNENAIVHASTELDKERIRERNAELVNGLVKLVVGGGHLAGIQERADRCDDAIKAAQACFKNGALPGCGASYIRAGALAGVGEELRRAFRVVHNQIMENFGETPFESFEAGQTASITETGVELGDFVQLKIADSFDTVSSVIRNATELAILFSTMGGFSLTSDLDQLEQIHRVKNVMGGM